MRRAALAFAFAIVACSACATVQPTTPPATTTTPPPPPEKLKVSAAGLHPASSTRTIGDQRALVPKLLTSVALERSALTGEAPVEPWASRALISWLLEHGAEVRGDGVASTSKLVGVRFGLLKEDVTVAVAPADEGDGWFVRYWAGDKDMSECAPALKVPMTYVQFEGVLVDDKQRFVASFAEIVAAQPSSLQVELELRGRAPCDAVAAAFSDEFAPSESEILKAADAALDQGFRALVAPDPGPPPPPQSH